MILAVVLALILQAAPQAPAAAAAARPPSEDGRPSLIVVIVVDMLPAGTLERFADSLTGGFRRLLREGRSFSRCAHDHAATMTGPGHATLLSGLHPRSHGVILNAWYERASRREVGCVEDLSPAARPDFDGSPAVSTARLKGENLSDLIKRALPGSRVHAVAGKDRSALLSAGHAPDGAYWYSEATGGLTSSPQVMTAPPSWGIEFWGPEPTSAKLYRAGVPPTWEYPIRTQAAPDDSAHENSKDSRVSPRPLTSFADPSLSPERRLKEMARRVGNSPWLDWITLEAAARIVEKERLGRDASPDLLIVGLSSPDKVGHGYGPDSQEYLDTILRLDGWLGDFMRRAERAADAAVLYALSSDHGVLPLPERVQGGRRVKSDRLKAAVEAALRSAFPQPDDQGVIEDSTGGHIWLDHARIVGAGRTAAEAIEAAGRTLAGIDGIARIHTASQLAASPDGDAFRALYRNAYDPERGGDLVVQPCESCLITGSDEGTSHGSPYEYDRRVPMIFLGPGVEPGRDEGACRTVDLAPTLAAVLGLRFGAPRDGAPLPLQAAPRVDRPGHRK